jgi:hypothetical protein
MLKRLSIVSLLFVLSACIKDTIVQSSIEETGTAPSLVVSFKAIANSKTLIPVTGTYTNTSYDEYGVTKFNYFISNVVLTSSDGARFVEPESYHLIKHIGGLTSFTITNLPKGTYTKIEFLMGVDSLRNVSGSQTGALDIGNDMYWTWDNGYIFFKLEGTYTSNNVSVKDNYVIHIGGFAGKYKCLQNCSFNLAQPIEANINRQCKLFYITNLDEIFTKPKTIGFDYYYENVNDPTFQLISINYKDMFVVEKVEN